MRLGAHRVAYICSATAPMCGADLGRSAPAAARSSAASARACPRRGCDAGRAPGAGARAAVARCADRARAHVAVPLHFDAAADPAGRRAVVSGIDFDAAIEVHAPLAELVVAKRLQRQRQQRRLLFGEHRCDLALGRAVDARVGPAALPSDPDTPAPLRGSRSAGPSAASSCACPTPRSTLPLRSGSRTRHGSATAP